MNQPALYHKSHRAAKHDVGQILKEYSSRLCWRSDGRDALIDIGSGPGDVLMDYMYPLMPPSYTKIVCSDISKDMVEFARSMYGQVSEKWEFKILDIATKMPLPAELKGNFDHAISMLCLHWVQDHRTALENIYELLRPHEGGDCLLVFMSTHTIFDAYDYTSKYTKWSEYMKDVDRFISPLHGSNNAAEEFAQLMEEVGFSEVKVEIRPKTFSYGNVENFKENIKSVCGTLDAIPLSSQSDFLDDFIAIMGEYAYRSGDLSEKDSKYTMKYDLIVAYGKRKPKEDDD